MGQSSRDHVEMPAQICPNCREAYINENVTSELLKDVEERARTGAQVEIR